MIRIGIDARFYGSVGKGLGRYTQKLIENLEKIETESGSDRKYFVFLRQENFSEYQPRNKNFHKVLADYRWYTFAEQLYFPRLLLKYNLNIVHFPHFNVPLFYRRKFIVTIHDLILLHFPTLKNTTLNPVFYWLKFLVYKIVIGSAIKRASKIIAVSNFTKQDILKNYPNSADKIKVTYEACGVKEENLNLDNDNKNILKKYGIIKSYLLYVGNAYPHKNLEKLVLAWQEVQKKSTIDTQLVLVGGTDYFYDRLKKWVVANKIPNIIFSGFVPDKDLAVLYKEAVAFVFPSLYEGFGLPPLEAMQSGLPVISSKEACLTEILGDAVYYFDGNSIMSISDAILEIIVNEELRINLVQQGYQQIKKYSWRKMAEQTMVNYEL